MAAATLGAIAGRGAAGDRQEPRPRQPRTAPCRDAGMNAGWCIGVRGMAADNMRVAWAESSGRRRAAVAEREGLRFAFYGRVSTEDWQDPVSSRTHRDGRPDPGAGQLPRRAAAV